MEATKKIVCVNTSESFDYIVELELQSLFYKLVPNP